MTLGEHITALRSRHHMSQGDLAERLNVSRQSVSKWETDTSVPDLDKLIALSDLFQVSLDELIRGPLQDPAAATQQTTATAGQQTTQQATANAITLQHKIGAILMIASILLTLITMLGDYENENFILVDFLLFLCGTICLLAKRYAVIGVTWAIGIPLMCWGSSVGGGAGLLFFLLMLLITFRFYYAS